tara:strand:- start:126 stop:386 length:261 start_codon:yes stop_codon:yes gene_type:complete
MKAIKNLTVKFAENYIYYNYGYLKHDIKKLVKASKQTAKQYNVSPLQMFLFMIEQQPINELCTHSYIFNTSVGREVKETFKNYYNV